MSENACCAHVSVIWTTEDDHRGVTHGWWECSQCEAQFVPLARAVRCERRAADLEQDRSDVWRTLGIAQDADADAAIAAIYRRAPMSETLTPNPPR